MVSLESQNIYEVPFKASVECVAFSLCECEFHDFAQKLLFSSGEVFLKQASPRQTSVGPYELQNIIEAPFKGFCSMHRICFV